MTTPPVRVAILPGDGIGEEVLEGPTRVLTWLREREVVDWTGPWEIGATAHARCGALLPQRTIDACADADYVLLGAVGEHPGIEVERPERGLLALRERFDLRVNVRWITWTDDNRLTIVRNLLGGAYGSERREAGADGCAADLLELDASRIREVAEMAVAHALRDAGQLVSVDKANLFATSRLWRAVVTEVAERHGVVVRHVYVDQAAYELARDGLRNAVIVTEGIFGDILSDLASGRAGSIALCSSASIAGLTSGDTSSFAVFEPSHGSAPGRVGQDRVNPAGAFLALASLLCFDRRTAEWGELLQRAVLDVLRRGPRTYDLARGELPASTSQFSQAVSSAFVREAERGRADGA